MNIQGQTFHSAFHINPNQSLGIDNQRVCESELNTLRCRFRELALVVVDGMSMVERKMLAIIDDRLKQIRGSSEPFGGVSMIFVGDLNQLKPVMDDWVFNFPKARSEVLGLIYGKIM